MPAALLSRQGNWACITKEQLFPFQSLPSPLLSLLLQLLWLAHTLYSIRQAKHTGGRCRGSLGRDAHATAGLETSI